MKKYSLEPRGRVQGMGLSLSLSLSLSRSMVQGLANRPLFGEGQEVSSTFPEVGYRKVPGASQHLSSVVAYDG